MDAGPGDDSSDGPRRVPLSPQDYDARWARISAAGGNPHGEADFVESLGPHRVLDAGCGTGRVAIELAARGIRTAGVDIDGELLAQARCKAPDLRWEQADLSELDLRDSAGERERFDLVVLAGNVVVFLEPGSEAMVLARLADHLETGGLLVAGFQIGRGGPDAAGWDRLTGDASFVTVERHGGWHREPWDPAGGYIVAVHRLASG